MKQTVDVTAYVLLLKKSFVFHIYHFNFKIEMIATLGHGHTKHVLS
jgi:hypothetical protein